MNKTLQRVGKKIIDNWDVIIIISVTTPLLILDTLPDDLALSITLSEKGFLGLILLALIGISVSQLRSNPRSLQMDFSRSQQKLSDLLLLTKGKISAVRPDKETSIWEGFVGNFYAINPPWLIEMRSVENQDSMVNKHIARYTNAKFNRAVYIFFTHGEDRCYFSQAEKYFVSFAQKLMDKSPHAAEKVEVIIAKEPAPGFTLFVGNKETHGKETHGKETSVLPYSIFYLNEKPLMSKMGFPLWAFVTVNDDLNTSLEDYAKDLANEYEAVPLREYMARSKETLERPH
ncbi:MAG: hypothetical protein OET90_01375 [Desulfuromonadales bacterium]|nr:hypothetical protein [Desulfuromonadales bacterium]